MRIGLKAACGLVIVCVVGLASAHAQTSAVSPVTAQKLALAQQVVDASGARRNSDAVMRTMLQQMSSAMGASLGGPGDKTFLDNLMQDEFSKISAKVQASSAQIYAQTFTDKELSDLLSFYQSPSGRSFVDKTPQLVRETNAVVMPLIPPLQRDILDRVFAYACTKQKCTPEQLKQIAAAKQRVLTPPQPVARPAAAAPH